MRHLLWSAALITGSLVCASGVARAGVLDACNNVTLPLSANCEVIPPGVECSGQCTPIQMEVSCARELYTECAPQCTAQIVQEEVQVCSNECVTECNVNPGSFDCSATCGGQCSADCSAKCSTSANSSQCMASCQASCTGYCDVDCKAVLPSMSCEQKCAQTCHGVVVSRVNMDCQLQCQTKERYTDCETRLTGGCTASCNTTDGALFCDVNGARQYIDFVGSLDACVDALRNLKFNVNWHVSASVEVSGCQMGGKPPTGGFILLLLGIVPLVLRRRRRR